MTPNQRHNRRMMVQLLVMAAAIFALSIAEDMRAERDAQSEQVSGGSPRVAATYALGSRAVLPEPEGHSAERPSKQAFLQVVTATEFQNWVDSSASANWELSVPDCLISWWLLDQGIEGEMQFEFVVGSQGLQEIAVVHHQEVPAGPAKCLSAAFHAQSWPTTSGQVVVAVYDLAFSNRGAEAVSGRESTSVGETEENRFHEGGRPGSGLEQ